MESLRTLNLQHKRCLFGVRFLFTGKHSEEAKAALLSVFMFSVNRIQ
ncbi:Hypothetical protein ACI5QM_03081 [Bacillus subtilis]